MFSIRIAGDQTVQRDYVSRVSPFERLPIELVSMIIDSLQTPKDLRALGQVSRTLRGMINGPESAHWFRLVWRTYDSCYAALAHATPKDVYLARQKALTYPRRFGFGPLGPAEGLAEQVIIEMIDDAFENDYGFPRELPPSSRNVPLLRAYVLDHPIFKAGGLPALVDHDEDGSVSLAIFAILSPIAFEQDDSAVANLGLTMETASSNICAYPILTSNAEVHLSWLLRHIQAWAILFSYQRQGTIQFSREGLPENLMDLEIQKPVLFRQRIRGNMQEPSWVREWIGVSIPKHQLAGFRLSGDERDIDGEVKMDYMKITSLIPLGDDLTPHWPIEFEEHFCTHEHTRFERQFFTAAVGKPESWHGEAVAVGCFMYLPEQHGQKGFLRFCMMVVIPEFFEGDVTSSQSTFVANLSPREALEYHDSKEMSNPIMVAYDGIVIPGYSTIVGHSWVPNSRTRRHFNGLCENPDCGTTNETVENFMWYAKLP